MMEKYVFRGYDVIGNKWVYGDLVHNQKVTATGLEPRTMVGGYEVHPDSVGLKFELPVSFVELYEGDIVRFESKGTLEGRVSIAMGCGCVIGEFGLYWLHDFFRCQKIEVVGNVYERGDFGLSTDNPEQIKR